MVRASPHTPHHNERRTFSLSQDTALLSASASYDQQQQEMFITNIVSLKGHMGRFLQDGENSCFVSFFRCASISCFQAVTK